MPEWLPLAVAGVGGVHVWAYYGERKALAGTLKALPILFLAVTVLVVPAIDAGYARLVAAGLVASAVGDVCLVSPSGFVPGLTAFLVGHLAYLAAFTFVGPVPALDPRWLAAVGVVAAALLAVLWPRVGRLRLPVTAYVAVIGAMAVAATSRAETMGVPAASGTTAALGALIFMLSDAILALNRFVRPLPAAHGWVMLTYYTAQTLIAWSVAA